MDGICETVLPTPASLMSDASRADSELSPDGSDNIRIEILELAETRA